MDFIKRNFALLLAFILPIALIAAFALSTYLPAFFLSTDYDFIYATCAEGRDYPYRCNDYLQKRFSVANGRLIVSPVDMTRDTDKNGVPDYAGTYSGRIFLHDTKKNESREITADEAQALSLNGLLTSPDGVTVSSYHDGNGGDIFFVFGGRSSSYGYYLMKGKSRAKINLINATDRYYYQNNFEFIGWVLPGRSAK